mmetsp:Transcript_2216/g.2469  ORF Transcript_2216/g.2469 Transcript_2216/m.2469 type:complete len:158 (+) Transcript_2216:481-954(+)
MFSISHWDCHCEWFGKSTRPILYALCLVTKLGLGVTLKWDNSGYFYCVTNHDLFMLAFSVFTIQKPKKAKDDYSTYKAMGRWVEMLDHRRRGKQWRFKIRKDELEVWKNVVNAVTAFLETNPCLFWTWTCNGMVDVLPLQTPELQLQLESVLWASKL